MKSKLALAAALLLMVPRPAVADEVTDWNNLALEAIRLDGTAPPQASRALAILHVAIYDAVNGITRRGEPYSVVGKIQAGASTEAAAAAAAHLVLRELFPASAGRFDGAYAVSLSRVRKSPHRNAGIAWGETVARAILQERAADAADHPGNYSPGNDPGQWQPTLPGFAAALLPQWAGLTPFGITSPVDFRTAGPPILASPEYAIEFEQVRLYGALHSPVRTAEQAQIALFWSNGAGTATPPGHWNQIAQTLSKARRLGLEDNARLFAFLNIALADAAVVAWDCKYAFDLWRPVTAIHLADLDGNPATAPDTSWLPLLTTPPFPEYVSGHSTFSGAAAAVLAGFFGRDDIPFESGSDGLPGAIRRFHSFSHAAEESGISRIYGGIHFMSANLHGLEAGRNLGAYVIEEFLSPRKNRGRLRNAR